MAKAPAPVKPKKALAKAARPTLQQSAQTEIDPIIAAITGAANAKAKAADAAISGYTQSYANQLGQINAGAPYGDAEAKQAAVDAALESSLQGGGADLASQLSARLSALNGSSGEGAVQQAGTGLASQGASAGGAVTANGSAALGQLIGEHAAADTFSKKLPGLAKLSGLQGIKQVQGNAQQDINQGTLSAESQLPSIEQQIRSSRQAAAALKSTNAYRGAELGLSSQRNQIAQFRANTSAAQGNARIAISQQNANTAATRAAQTAFNDNRSYGIRLAQLGISQKHLQLEALKAEAQKQGGGFSPIEVAHFRADAATIATNAFKGFTDSHGNVHPKLSFQQAMNEMVQGAGHGAVPPSMAIKALKAAGYNPPGPALSGVFGTAVLGSLFHKAFTIPGVTDPVQSGAANTIVRLAQQYKGTPYVWGGESPKGFDCSGFAQYLYGKAGINIPRTTYTQWQTGHSVPPGQLQPGDLVFFRGSDSVGGLPGHVGIYIGGGRMIDAPHTGASVRVESVGTFGGYMGARRYSKG